jgi:hypothetical protein
MRVSKWLLVAALSLSIGMHWTILQSVAWFGMAISYSQGGSIKEGLAKIFDGRHPCKLCKIIEEGKKSEKKQEAQLKIAKADLFPPSEFNRLSTPPLLPASFRAGSTLLTRTEAPLTPPPRVA